MRRILEVLHWRIQFSLYGRKRGYWGLLQGWQWSECWPDWDDERGGLNDPHDSANEEIFSARLVA